MGLLNDALQLGLITQDQYNDMAEYWTQLGRDAKNMGDTEAFQKMTYDFLDLGFLDLADACAQEMLASIDYYETLYGGLIVYEMQSSHWKSTVTGQYIIDPYQWIRED
jgi:hypothetical protein